MTCDFAFFQHGGVVSVGFIAVGGYEFRRRFVINLVNGKRSNRPVKSVTDIFVDNGNLITTFNDHCNFTGSKVLNG